MIYFTFSSLLLDWDSMMLFFLSQSVAYAKGRRKMVCVILTIVASIVTAVIILAVIVVVAVLTRQ